MTSASAPVPPATASSAATPADWRFEARSGTSRSAQESTNATAVSAEPTRKTGCSACTNADRKSCWIAAGRLCTSAGLMFRPPLKRAPTSGGNFDSSPLRRAAKIAPNSATPSEPPIERKNVSRAVADAEVLGGDVVLDREHEHLHDQAEAEADDDHVEDASQRRRVDLQAREQEHADVVIARAGDREAPCSGRCG